MIYRERLQRIRERVISVEVLERIDGTTEEGELIMVDIPDLIAEIEGLQECLGVGQPCPNRCPHYETIKQLSQENTKLRALMSSSQDMKEEFVSTNIGRHGGLLMEDGTEIVIAQPEENGSMRLETVFQYHGESVKILGMSMVKEWTPREQWGEIARRYLKT